MGCRISFPFLPAWASLGLATLGVEEEKEDGQVKEYSWDKLRVELDLSQYVIDSQEGGEVIRRPGQSPGSEQKNFCTYEEAEFNIL